MMAFLGLSPPSAPSFFEVGASRLPESRRKTRWGGARLGDKSSKNFGVHSSSLKSV